MQAYLQSSEQIDWQTPTLVTQAQSLAEGLDSQLDIAKACFEFVRDHIKHSLDYRLNPVTCKASDVLKHGTGYCYAKSHLLAALLRANGIPAGLCYQRLTIENNNPPFCLHGLNAVYLEDYGWYRIDARGNKTGVDAQFRPPLEQLAFPILIAGEIDLPEIWTEPLDLIVNYLQSHKHFDAAAKNLPDIQLISC
ncbi:MAG: Cro/Cl family transcriptional regulator [SAR86 cluster bacterium]|uniref:Cro/Cl family transcriptional regulator n=1 Tax=SAR86 cluster bacterium TaxID=2030880 RepID=A0A2A4MFT4_9GAMM|nr:MAG: Cro/Cl family transcriptional regulator [SAR86 cluster bacterium]